MPTLLNSLAIIIKSERHGLMGDMMLLTLFYGLWVWGGADATFPKGKWIDLTYEFSEETVYWPTSEGFKLDVVASGEMEAGFYYEANNFAASEHGGTHLDAPAHFAKDRMTTEKLPLERLIGPVAVVDVSEKALKNPDYLVQISDFKAWEKKHGKLADGIIILLRTGFGQFWPNREKYLGTDQRGERAVAKLHFPGLAPKAASWLVTHRNIHAIGLDTASIDYGQSKQYKSHQILFEHNIPAFENVANLDRLPAKGALVVALPMKIKGGSGAPLRIVALVP